MVVIAVVNLDSAIGKEGRVEGRVRFRAYCELHMCLEQYSRAQLLAGLFYFELQNPNRFRVRRNATSHHNRRVGMVYDDGELFCERDALLEEGWFQSGIKILTLE